MLYGKWMFISISMNKVPWHIYVWYDILTSFSRRRNMTIQSTCQHKLEPEQ